MSKAILQIRQCFLLIMQTFHFCCIISWSLQYFLFIRPQLKMWGYYAMPRSSICPSVPLTLSLQHRLNPLGDFDETWYKERSHIGDVHIA
jgi:hypothetical protein